MSRPASAQAHVVVDMTPLGPNGQNGGAGLVATSLVRELSGLAPDLQLTLLTAAESHAELAALDAPNVSRRCVGVLEARPSPVRTLADRLLPTGARVRLKDVYRSLRTSRRNASVTADLRPDLLLCPFTVPYFWRDGVPCLSIVYDLQQVRYPEFFTPEQRLNRQRHLVEACARSDRVVCISEYVRGTLIGSVDVSADKVVTIPLGLLHQAAGSDAAVLDRLRLRGRSFLLYPANFWPHKNHRRLFEALPTGLCLVCTGAPNALMAELQTAAPPSAVFAGYVTDAELAALYAACAALIFPSLYEGFGMPVLEAMALGKPVLCSDVTSLPEVASDAAVYFDPTDPAAIAAAIAALADPARIAELSGRGPARAQHFGDARTMAERYLPLIRELLCSASR